MYYRIPCQIFRRTASKPKHTRSNQRNCRTGGSNRWHIQTTHHPPARFANRYIRHASGSCVEPFRDLQHPYVKHATKNILQKQKSQTIKRSSIVWDFWFLILDCQEQFSYLHESQRFRFFYFWMILIEWCIPERKIQR